jgi:hypothetical protein
MVQHFLAPYKLVSLNPEITATYLMRKNVVTSQYAVQLAYNGNPRAEKVDSSHDDSDFYAGGAVFES